MSNRRRRKLDQTVTLLQKRYGRQALQRGARGVQQRRPAAFGSGFAQLDALTGCGGVPRGALTLLTGPATSGKLTLGYKILADAQQTRNAYVALIDLARHTDPDYLARCGIELTRLLVARPDEATDLGALLVDLTRERRVRALLLDNLTSVALDRRRWRQLQGAFDPLIHHLRRHQTTLLCIDELNPPWLRWLNLDRSAPVRRAVALHLHFRRERWLREAGELTGYRAQVQVSKSLWRRDQPSAQIEIRFNGTVRAGETL